MSIWKVSSKELFFNQILKHSEEEVIEVLQNDKDKYYQNIIVLPKKGGSRIIYCIDKTCKLYEIQRNICINFLSNIMLSDSAYGFIKGSNYMDYLYPHTNFYKRNYYLRIDIKNFFYSINYEMLKSVISYYFEVNESLEEEEKEQLVNYTLDILTYKESVVQGAVSSPLVSNIVFRSLDIRISRYCRKFNIRYTRYADDLLFSSESSRIHSKVFMSGIAKILADKCFYINYNKIIKSKEEISLGGYIVSDSIRLSRKKLVNLNRVLFYLENNRYENTVKYFETMKMVFDSQGMDKYIESSYTLINFLSGYRSFLINILRYSKEDKFIKKIKHLIKRVEQSILKVDKQ